MVFIRGDGSQIQPKFLGVLTVEEGVGVKLLVGLAWLVEKLGEIADRVCKIQPGALYQVLKETKSPPVVERCVGRISLDWGQEDVEW